MTYIPTKSELEELGFIWSGDDYYKECRYSFIHSLKNETRISFGNGVMYAVYPQSLDDIRTLIRLLTPQ